MVTVTGYSGRAIALVTIIFLAALVVFGALAVTPARAADTCANPANPIVAENCQPGTDEWITQNPIGDIFGYASADSVNRSETLEFFVDTTSPTFDMRIYRNGYYGGLGGRFITAFEALPGRAQPDCQSDAMTGLVSCANWSVSHQLTIPNEWVSGIYIARIIRPDTGGDNYIMFVVRDDARDADILYQQSVSTFQAYNNFGNKSLYSSSSGFCLTVAEAPRAVKVSYNRPYNQTMADPNSYFRAEYPMVRWLEQQGYDLTYSTTSDTHQSGISGNHNELLDHQVFLSIGHDEYWTQEMRDAVITARDAGVHLGFFTANTSYWRIRLEPDPITGEADSTIVTYKTIESGGPDPSGFSTSTWRDPDGPAAPENSFQGVMYIGDNDSLLFPLRVTAETASHPLYRHTGLETMPPETYINIGTGIFGWEWDATVTNGQTPANLEILAESPVYGMLLQDAGLFENGNLQQANAQTTFYTAPSGAKVFASGTIQWSWGLGAHGIQPAAAEPIIAQITYNVLADMEVQPATPADIIPDGADTPPPALDSTRLLSTTLKPPVISEVQAQVEGDSVTMSWKTDVPTIGQIWFGGRSGHIIFPMGEDLEYTTEHRVTLTDLTTPKDFKVGASVFGTATRFYQVTATDQNWNHSISDEYQFEVGTAPLSTRLRNNFNQLTRPVRCFAQANLGLTIGIAAGGGLLLLALLVLGFRAVRRRRTTSPA